MSTVFRHFRPAVLVKQRVSVKLHEEFLPTASFLDLWLCSLVQEKTEGRRRLFTEQNGHGCAQTRGEAFCPFDLSSTHHRCRPIRVRVLRWFIFLNWVRGVVLGV
ncbi:hypothetical protein CMV_025127 [Castanea mollissima]|uniref:Uncharacterized protein n=1 Tax=Castanea mollissima TaxID=60419 RepID=A0A8J4QMI6_9ROSI|nr:hypothetical protein CMV_025127 [Castanea mollissima]